MTMPRPQGDTRPKEVGISFWIWVGAVVLGVVGAIVTYLEIEQVRAEAISQNLSLDRSVIAGVLMAGVMIPLLFWATMLAFAFLMRGGRDWARIMLAVLGGLGVLFLLIGLAVSLTSSAAARAVPGLLQLPLLIGAIVTMFRPVANAWFRPRDPDLEIRR